MSSTTVLQLQTEWLSGEGIKNQPKGQTYWGTQFQVLACGCLALSLLSLWRSSKSLCRDYAIEPNCSLLAPRKQSEKGRGLGSLLNDLTSSK